MLYFHGNAEDVGHNMPLLYHFREKFKCSVLAMEYPGYGFFSHQIVDGQQTDKKLSCSAKRIARNARFVY